MIPVVVINLARASDRRAAMQANLAERGISFSFFEGVDGRKMSAAELAAFLYGVVPGTAPAATPEGALSP